jgi:Fe2+ transport system protein FeoA
VRRLELGVTQGSDCLGRSAPLGLQTLERGINGTKLALQRYALGRLG